MKTGYSGYLHIRLGEMAASMLPLLPFCPLENWSTEFVKVSIRNTDIHPLNIFPNGSKPGILLDTQDPRTSLKGTHSLVWVAIFILKSVVVVAMVVMTFVLLRIC